jgi:two-component system chemotaxis sensor kinase CheA
VDSSRYADLFLTESREHLSAVNHWLLALERSGARRGAPGGDARAGEEAVAALFRAVHTVKGMSATMGYGPVTELAHEMETLLDGLRRGGSAVTPELMDALFQAADALERAIELAAAGRPGDADVARAVGRLRGFAGGAAGARSEGESAGAGADGAASWAVPAPDGDGLLVRVRLEDGTPLRGVRAFLAIEKVKAVGTVAATSPSAERLRADDFDGEFALRLVTSATAADVERAVRAAGFVQRVEVAAEGGPAASDEPPAPGEGAPPGDGAQPRQQRHVRIEARRLDALMNLIGELVITRGRLTQLAGTIGDPALEEAVAQTSRLVSELQDEIMTSRMVPVWQVFDRFPRVVRDAARSLGKEVELTVEGKEIEIDRSMLDEIGEPVVHLLRNAVDHGIETPDVRVAAGKPAAGRVTLSTLRDRSAVLVRVTDDGRGINRARVLARAQELGLADKSKTELTDDELFRIVSRPGFSTATKITDLSGRGVGVDAVHNRVRALGGSVEMTSTPGEGTTVTLRLPLTLAIVTALLARVGAERYAIPLTHVSETVELRADALRTVKGREVIVLRDDVLPLLRMRRLVRHAEPARPGGHVVVLEMGSRRAGLVVDEFTGQQEVVVKQFDAVRGGLPLFSGATILGDGVPALILDVGSLVA